jgi:hypothetical protein
MSDTTYSGWTNYETWNCKLWIDNDQGNLEYWRERAKDVESIENGYMDEPRRKVHALADALQDEFEQQAEDHVPLMSGFFADIMNAALTRVNWVEIAESLLEKVKEVEA